MSPILTITGSDNSGWSGLQLDLRTISEMGGHALTAASCIVMQDDRHIRNVFDFPVSVIQQQISSVVSDFHPKAVKIGLLHGRESVRIVRDEIIGCGQIVIAPGVVSSNGTQLIDDDTLEAIKQYLIPEAKLLVLRCLEAEKILGLRISTDDDMLSAAKSLVSLGAEYVLLRGGAVNEGRVTALLYTEAQSLPGSTFSASFFSSYNIEGWQKHGVGGALSAAIATRLAMGDDVPAAISNAHEYVHSRIVYSVSDEGRRMRPADIYNRFMSLISAHYLTAHDVAFYADRLSITPRYLSQITSDTVGKSPKQIIAEYLVHEAKTLLENTRLSVKEIAVKLGFSSSSVFCKFFRQQQGVTPNEYRISVESLSKQE